MKAVHGDRLAKPTLFLEHIFPSPQRKSQNNAAQMEFPSLIPSPMLAAQQERTPATTNTTPYDPN